jgi:aspartyl protease family protein
MLTKLNNYDMKTVVAGSKTLPQESVCLAKQDSMLPERITVHVVLRKLTFGSEVSRMSCVWGPKMMVIVFCIVLLTIFVSPGNAEMYKWVDDKGTVHFTDDFSTIPEKYREDAETRKPKETSAPQANEKPKPPSVPSKAPEPEGVSVDLVRKHELLLAEVVLNGRIRQYFIVDTGASFTLINKTTAKELGITVDETTPFIPIFTASSLIFTPLVTLSSIRVGDAEVENVDALIYNMPSESAGLLGNSFLNKFKVVIDSMNGKMTLHSMQGKPSPDRPGGYGKDYWIGQFRFCNRNLEELRKLKVKIESRGASAELARVNNAIRYFENQLNELERKASFAGVPRNWRQ